MITHALVIHPDVEPVLALLSVAFNNPRGSAELGYAERSIEECIQNPEGDYAWYVAKQAREVVATLMIQRHTVIFGVHSLMWLAVEEKYQRQGVARQLITHAGQTEAVRETSTREAVIVLGTEEENRGFYDHMGFSFIGPLQTGYVAFSQKFGAAL